MELVSPTSWAVVRAEILMAKAEVNLLAGALGQAEAACAQRCASMKTGTRRLPPNRYGTASPASTLTPKPTRPSATHLRHWAGLTRRSVIPRPALSRWASRGTPLALVTLRARPWAWPWRAYPPYWSTADCLVSTRELLRIWTFWVPSRSGRPGIAPTSACRRRGPGPGSPRPGAPWRPGLECAPGPAAAACQPR